MARREISEQTLGWLEVLERPRSALSRVLKRGTSAASLLDRIGESGELAAVVRIVDFVLDDHPEVARAAVRAVSKLFARAEVSDLPWLDERLRSGYWSARSPRWRCIKDYQVGELAAVEGGSPVLAQLASMHASGYVREVALDQLGLMASPAGLPFFLLRLNDWVAPVRTLASRLVTERLQAENAAAWVACLPLVVRLDALQRADHSGIVRSVLDLLQRSGCSDALAEGLRAKDRKVRRVTYRVASRNPGTAGESLLRSGLVDPDVLVRIWAARMVGEAVDSEALAGFCEILERDPLYSLRCIALEQRLEHLPETAEAKLVEFLFDRSAGVRATCQYYLRKHFERDPAEVYRQSGPYGDAALRARLLGLGETGSAEDAATCRPYLGHFRPAIRAAALRAMSRLARELPVAECLEALSDDFGSVSFEARQALLRNRSRIDRATLESIFDSAEVVHVRRNVLMVAGRQQLWEGLPLLLRGACDVDVGVHRTAEILLVKWLSRSSRSYVAPSEPQIERAGQALERCRLQLGVEAGPWKMIEFQINHARSLG